jgi:hypothetical protein
MIVFENNTHIIEVYDKKIKKSDLTIKEFWSCGKDQHPKYIKKHLTFESALNAITKL